MNRIPACFILLALMASACTSPAPPPAKGYYGPTLPLEEVVAKINENNAKIPTLWSREHFAATLVDRPNNKSARVDGYGNLMYTGPNQLKLTAQNEVESLFEMGSDGEHFWLWEKHDSEFWWGDYADVGSMNSEEIPVRPDMVMEILGIRPIDPFLDKAPLPTMRFNNFADAYMVDWMAPGNGHWVVIKEIWYDRATLQPRRVLIFDSGGRLALWAQLSNFLPVEVKGLDKSRWPTMASRFDLSFPYSGTKMTFELSDMVLTRNGRPSDASYRMPVADDLSRHGVKVHHIEAGSEIEGGSH